MYRLDGHDGRELSLTSSEGCDVSRPSMFGFRVYDSEWTDSSVARQELLEPAARGDEPEFRQTPTQGRYQRQQTVCRSVYAAPLTSRYIVDCSPSVCPRL